MTACEYCTDFDAKTFGMHQDKVVGNIMNVDFKIDNCGMLSVNAEAKYVSDAKHEVKSKHITRTVTNIAINFCPMCGRPLRDKLLFVKEAKQVQSVTRLRNERKLHSMLLRFAEHTWYDKDTDTAIKPCYFSMTSDNEIDVCIVALIDSVTMQTLNKSARISITEMSNIVNTWQHFTVKPASYPATQVKAKLAHIDKMLEYYTNK